MAPQCCSKRLPWPVNVPSAEPNATARASTPTAQPVAQLSGVSKVYGQGETEVRALDGLDLTVNQGDYLAVMGASGSARAQP